MAISFMKIPAFLLLAFALGVSFARAADDVVYTKEVETWRAERVARLTTADGWLSLIGLHFLKDGDNTVGSAKDNDVVLAKGPAHLGKVTVVAEGRARRGRKTNLAHTTGAPGAPLFFVISDATSGKETYGAARFLYADAPVDGKVTLDFNRMQTPPCAFTPFATCPLPPKENRL